MCSSHNVKCSYPLGFMCVCGVRCSCVSKQRWFSEVSVPRYLRYFHDWSSPGTMKVPRRRKRTKHVLKELTDGGRSFTPRVTPMQHEKETKKRVENELLTKPEKRFCSTRCLYNTFRQDGSHETEEDRKVLGRGRTSGLALLRDRRRAGCS